MASNVNTSDRVEDVMDSLDSLEDILAPLLAKPLSDTLSKLEVLEQAKLQTTLAYVTQDLIFMYLKARGIDPATHPVMGQMTEIAKYFNKIKDAEDPAKRKLTVDKGAAKRFIDAALSDALSSVAPAERGLAPTSARDANQKGGLEAHLKKTEKMIERERLHEESSSDEDEDIQMFDGDEAEEKVEASSKLAPRTGANDAGAESRSSSSTLKPPESTAEKMKRVAMDPFQGAYFDLTRRDIERRRISFLRNHVRL
ncbi:hypothetical protein M407DRAFT_126362 [Tulasnella calospora MUT 4182]|uniref:Exosome complex protein n=1 Tax=Tulasnella calospora MUT 4182 TaxID=1051891 RepID=A0A0C3QAY9_9AGAM|nr:hypothetical protein M407DRAFT_126362 [Tulasnella calospora MUT 4182]